MVHIGDPRPAPFEGTINLQRWIVHFEAFMRQHKRPYDEWADYALHYHIADPIREALERIRHVLIEKAGWNVTWTWNLLTRTMVATQEQIDDASLWDSLKDVRKKHSTAFSMVEKSLIVGGVALLAPYAIISGLGAIGFSAAGPVAGSFAAAMQASVGAAEAGSAFALAQSVTMTPAILTAASGGAVVGAGALSAARVTGLAYDDKSPPSVTWEDGKRFQPSPELVQRLRREF